MPACAEMNRAIVELSVSYSTGEQNKDMTKSRQALDMKDTWMLLLALAERNPLTTHRDLINFMTVVHAESSFNVEKAREVGQSILDSMTGKSSIKVYGEKIQIDPQLLFQPLAIASQSLVDMSAIFKYEPCRYPPSLFDSSLMLLKPQKPALADAIWTKLPSDAIGPKGEVEYVLDGGALLHQVPWPRGFSRYREWEWKSCQGLLVPVMTHLTTAPDALLHVVRCNCSTDRSSLNCSC